MRFPLSLKVSLWLLINLLVLALLAGTWMLRTGGVGLTWDALVAGPSGSGVQALAEITHADLRNLPRQFWDDSLQRLATEKGIQIALYNDSLRPIAGEIDDLPDSVRDRLRKLRAQSAPSPAPQPRLGPEDRPPPPFARNPPPPAPLRDQRTLQRLGDPAAYWLGVSVGAPGRPGQFFILRIPHLWALVRLLNLDLLLWLALAAIACSILLWLPFVATHSRALRRLEHATQAIADGRFETRVPENRHDELGALGASINRMSGRLDRLVNGQKKFLGDVAHELGSPLGRMQMAVAILETRVAPDCQPAVNDVHEEVVQMSDLVAELLAFTRAGLLPRDAARVRVELSPLVQRVLDREASSAAVTLELPADLAVLADRELLGRALANLVRNAVRYAGHAGPVTLRAARHDTRVEITVEDHGPGVPPDALERLGEPFFRPETARQRETGGVGLGLSIVRACTETCGGTVRFANRTPHGFQATVVLTAA